MRARLLAPVLLALFSAPPARAAVVVVANYTTATIDFTAAEPGAKPAREHSVRSNHVLSVHVTGPADLTFRTAGRDTPHRVEPYNAYAFLPDAKAGVRLEGLELPGEPLPRDGKPELNPAARRPVKVPVTLLVDDAEPRAEALWKKELRARFDAVAAALEEGTGIRLEFAGFDTWKSDPEALNTSDLLVGFERTVRAKAGSLAVGFSSRKIDEKVDPSFGASRGVDGRHVLLSEARAKNESERAEAMLRFVAQALGACGSPDPGSAMRAKVGDGYLLRAGAVMRLDPLNALALSLWADERRRDPEADVTNVAPANRHRLVRAYKAILKAAPGDVLATSYLESLERDIGKVPEPEPKAVEPPPAAPGKRDELVKKIVRAVADRARQNAAAGAGALTGDELTAAYVRAAAEVAVRNPGPEMAPAFLVALGIALDDSDALLSDEANTAAAVKEFETPEERKSRAAALGNPTLAGRRDLCRRFFVGCAAGQLLPRHVAEKVAVERSLREVNSPAGMCLPALAAEFAGLSFARAAAGDPERVRAAASKFDAADYLPPLAGLRNGLSAEKFAELYGDADDARFAAVLADIRKRLQAMPEYK
jgi:hypothetical protein